MYKEDIDHFLQSDNKAQGSEQPAAAEAQATQTPVSQGGTRVEPLRGMKAAMAKQMVASVSTIPHFTYCDEIDLTELIELRLALKEQYAKQGIKLTMMPFFIKALSLAINEFPILMPRSMMIALK